MDGMVAADRASSLRDLLTREQRKFMACLAKHYSTKDIAETLGIAPRTVDDYRRRVYRKLKVHTSAAAVSKYYGQPSIQSGLSSGKAILLTGTRRDST